jgi:hypothetical protein
VTFLGRCQKLGQPVARFFRTLAQHGTGPQRRRHCTERTALRKPERLNGVALSATTGCPAAFTRGEWFERRRGGVIDAITTIKSPYYHDLLVSERARSAVRGEGLDAYWAVVRSRSRPSHRVGRAPQPIRDFAADSLQIAQCVIL